MNNQIIPGLGFIILSPEPNMGRLKSTRNSIWTNYGKDTPINCVVPKNTKAPEIKNCKELCPLIHKGKDTITSLINAGFKHTEADWNILVMEGVWIKANLDKRFATFLRSEKDILFTVVSDHDISGKPTKIYNNFWDCSLNGLMIHRKTFKEVGDLNDSALETSRLIWALNAIDLGCKFKAVLGARI